MGPHGGCDHCMAEKGQKTGHRKIRPKYSQPKKFNQAVHMDIVGPMSVETLGGKKWMLTMIDDRTGFTEVRILKNKRDTVQGITLWVSKMGGPKAHVRIMALSSKDFLSSIVRSTTLSGPTVRHTAHSRVAKLKDLIEQ